jgi:hypothetical protein
MRQLRNVHKTNFSASPGAMSNAGMKEQQAGESQEPGGENVNFHYEKFLIDGCGKLT